MTPEQEERLVAAFERLATAAECLVTPTVTIAEGINAGAAAVDLIAMTNDARFTVEHPPKPEPRDMSVSRLKTEEELIREQHGGEDAGDPIDRWTTLGPREAAYEAGTSDQGSEDPSNGSPRTPGRGPEKV